MKITIEISFDGETPMVTAKAQSQAQAALDARDAGAAPDLTASPSLATASLAAASATGALTDAGAPKPPPFDLPAGVLVATDYPATNKEESDLEVEDAGAAPQIN